MVNDPVYQSEQKRIVTTLCSIYTNTISAIQSATAIVHTIISPFIKRFHKLFNTSVYRAERKKIIDEYALIRRKQAALMWRDHRDELVAAQIYPIIKNMIIEIPIPSTSFINDFLMSAPSPQRVGGVIWFNPTSSKRRLITYYQSITIQRTKMHPKWKILYRRLTDLLVEHNITEKEQQICEKHLFDNWLV